MIKGSHHTEEGKRNIGEANKRNNGKDFYKRIGSLGGKKSRGGGFASNRELASMAGTRGGKVTKAEREKRKKKEYWLGQLRSGVHLLGKHSTKDNKRSKENLYEDSNHV